MFIPGPTQQLTNGYRGSFQWVTRSGRGVHLSPQSSAKEKNEWSYIFVLMAWSGANSPLYVFEHGVCFQEDSCQRFRRTVCLSLPSLPVT